MQHPLTRRRILAAGSAALFPLAGCVGNGPGASGPQERAYTLTVTRSGESLEMRIDPAGEVPDVIRINVGDTVEFTIVNEAGVPVGLHNHADDAEVVINPEAKRVMTFEATEAMTGRQEIEGWVAEDVGTNGPDEENGEHGGDATALAIIEVRPQGS